MKTNSETPHKSQFTVTQINDNPYTVPRPVAQEIESLRDELAQSLSLNDELREQSPAPPVLATTHVDGVDYGVSVAVAQEIERLHNEEEME